MSYTSPPDTTSLHSLNHYAGHKVVCTADEKKQSDLISGHAWNIINNRKEHEMYFPHVRANGHFVDESGRNTSHWFQRKGRVDLDGDGIIECVDSTNVQEVMVCPPTAGKEAAKARSRQQKQLCQAITPRNYGHYAVLRNTNSSAPLTPRKPGIMERRLPDQHRWQDAPPPLPTPRVLARPDWAPRRSEIRITPAPPSEHDMFRTVDQLRAESQMDVASSGFASTLHSARSRSLGVSGSNAVSLASTTRSLLREDLAPKQAGARTRHSENRVEASSAREITGWPGEQTHRLKREDHYYVKPVQQTGGSSVKFDIISNERKQFWY